MACHRIQEILLTLVVLNSAGEACAETVLRLASDDWCPYICAEKNEIKNGFLVDLTAKAMASEGYKVEALLRPLNRAMLETTNDKLEGVYAPPIDQRLRQSAPLAYSRACFYTRAGDSWTYRGMAAMKQRTIGVIEDYGYDDGPMDAYIAKYHQHPALIELAYGDTAGIKNLQKLLNGRFHVLLEHEAVLEQLSKQADASARIRQAGCLEHALPLTIGFSKQDPRSESWVRALQRGVQKLEASGELKALRQHYKLPATSP